MQRDEDSRRHQEALLVSYEDLTESCIRPSRHHLRSTIRRVPNLQKPLVELPVRLELRDEF